MNVYWDLFMQGGYEKLQSSLRPKCTFLPNKLSACVSLRELKNCLWLDYNKYSFLQNTLKYTLKLF